jgi:hypothetical protein
MGMLLSVGQYYNNYDKNRAHPGPYPDPTINPHSLFQGLLLDEYADRLGTFFIAQTSKSKAPQVCVSEHEAKVFNESLTLNKSLQILPYESPHAAQVAHESGNLQISGEIQGADHIFEQVTSSNSEEQIFCTLLPNNIQHKDTILVPQIAKETIHEGDFIQAIINGRAEVFNVTTCINYTSVRETKFFSGVSCYARSEDGSVNIEPGMSGTPLYDMRGNVTGVFIRGDNLFAPANS